MIEPELFSPFPCVMGCTVGFTTVVDGQDILNGGPGRFRVLKCRQCGLMITDPQPSSEEMGQYYPVTYSCFQPPPAIKTDRVGLWGSVLAVVKQAHRIIFDFRTDYIPPMPVGTMLEIGCATGGFMAFMKRRGWQVDGLEFSPHATAVARSCGLNVECASMESSAPRKTCYDLIVGWMVLEHLRDPVLALCKLKSWMQPTGRLVLSVPNAASLDFRLFGAFGYALQLPTHLFHYTPQTLRALLEANGWDVQSIVHQRTLGNYLGGMGLMLRERGMRRLGEYFIGRCRNPGSWRYFLYPLAWLMACLGQTGRMTVIARPRS